MTVVSETPTTVAGVLRAARHLIADPACWTKGAYARNDRDYPSDFPARYDACQWCGGGSVLAVEGIDPTHGNNPPNSEALFLLAAEARKRTGREPMELTEDIALFNDHPGTTHADVLDLFDAAITAAEARA